MVEKQLQFNARVAGFEQLNEQFMKVKINICHRGKNANRTDFTKTAMKDLERTVLGVPVVGEFDIDKREFKGHGGKLVVEEDRVEWVRTTQPYGFVPMDQIPFYETILEPDGLTKNDYLTVYAILWTELYPELYEAFEKKVQQSMEIRVGASEWDENGEYCLIQRATMSALCLLQAVKPCFKSSVVTNQFSENDFEQQYRRLVEQYQQYALGNGGEEMEDQKVLTPEVEEVMPEETTSDVVVEETPTTEEVATESEETTETVEEAPTSEEVEAEQAYAETEAETVEEPVIETPQNEDSTVVEEAEEAPATEEVDVPKADEVEVVDYEALYTELTTTHQATIQALEEMTTQFNALTAECDELKAFKSDVLAQRRQEEETALFARFEDLAGFEGFEALKQNASNFSLTDLEIQLFALAGRKMYSSKSSNSTASVALDTRTRKPNIPTVFGLLDEFITK